MKYAFFSDPSHGWLKVAVEEIYQLELSLGISTSSYISADNKYAYLEEDHDTPLFIEAAIKAGWFSSWKEFDSETGQYYSDPPSFIRNLQPFGSYQPKKAIPSIKVFKF